MGIDVGSISTKGTIIDENDNLLCGEYIYTKGNPLEAVKSCFVFWRRNSTPKTTELPPSALPAVQESSSELC